MTDTLAATAQAPAETREPGEEGLDVRLYLVDGSGYIFRAFHALPPMTRPDGTPVNAVFSGSPTCWPSCCASMSAPTSR